MGVFTFGRDLWDPSHRFETSWLVSPWVLFFFRALFALYAFVVQLFVIGWECTHPTNPFWPTCSDADDEFSYFTVLTYWGLAFYFLVAAIHTFTYALTSTPLLDRFPRPLQALHSLFYTSILVYPFIVTIVYWAVLFSGPWFALRFDAWSNISRHAMNSAFALFELVIPRTAPPPLIHMLWLIVILALYLALAYVTYATKHFYVYNFLDPGKQGSGIVAAYVIGIAVGCLIVFGVAWGLIWLRRWATETKMHADGKYAGRTPDWSEGDPNPHGDLEMARVHKYRE